MIAERILVDTKSSWKLHIVSAAVFFLVPAVVVPLWPKVLMPIWRVLSSGVFSDNFCISSFSVLGLFVCMAALVLGVIMYLGISTASSDPYMMGD